MPKNEFKPFAVGDGANVLDPDDYAGQGYLAQGFQNGVAQPYDVNTVLRQASTVAAAIAQFTADNQTADVLDDGVVANFETKFGAALKGAFAASSVHFGIATGTGDAMAVAATPPMVAKSGGGYQAGSFLVVKTPATPNTTTAPTVSVNSIGAVTITKPGSGALAIGDDPASTWIILFFDGTGCFRVGLTSSDVLGAGVLHETGADTASDPAHIATPATPPIITRQAGFAYIVTPGHTCAGATDLDVGFGVSSLTRQDGAALQAADYAAGEPLLVVDNGATFRLLGMVPGQIPSAPAPTGTEGVKVVSNVASWDIPGLTTNDALALIDSVGYFSAADGVHRKTGFGNFAEKVLSLFATVPGSAALLNPKVAYAREVRDQNTAARAFANGTWMTRILNDVGNGFNIPGASLGGDGGITLPANTYEIEAYGSAHAAGLHQIAIFDGSGNLLQLGSCNDSHVGAGTTGDGNTTNNSQILSFNVTFSTATTVYLKHQSYSYNSGESTQPTMGDNTTGYTQFTDAALNIKQQIGLA